jgi:hypothetical protein
LFSGFVGLLKELITPDRPSAILSKGRVPAGAATNTLMHGQNSLVEEEKRPRAAFECSQAEINSSPMEHNLLWEIPAQELNGLIRSMPIV